MRGRSFDHGPRDVLPDRPEAGRDPSRRSFIQRSAVAAMALGTGSGPVRRRGGARSRATRDKVIDAHAHLYHHSRPTWADDDRKLIEAGDRLGIDQFCCSILTPRRPATAEGFRDCNRWVADAMKRFPGRVLGYCYVNPGHTREAIEEVRRCVEDAGSSGSSSTTSTDAPTRSSSPSSSWRSSCASRSSTTRGTAITSSRTSPTSPTAAASPSSPGRYPEAMLICAHICGGGDWEWTIKALRDAPRVVAGPERERDGRRRRRDGGAGPRRRPAPVRLRHVDDRIRRPAPRGGAVAGRAAEDPRREHGAAARAGEA